MKAWLVTELGKPEQMIWAEIDQPKRSRDQVAIEICMEKGADAAFDYSTGSWLEAVKRETGQRGVDVVIDPVGGSTTEESARCLARDGRLIVVGFAGGVIASVATNRLFLRNASLCGVYWGAYAKNDPELLGSVFAAIFDMLGARKRSSRLSLRCFQSRMRPPRCE